MIHLDTHVLVWLFLEQSNRLPTGALARIEAEEVRCSPMAHLELACLHEIGRLVRTPADVLAALMPSVGLAVSQVSYADVVFHAMDLTWTRDPFDRLITANALAEGADLLTADERILDNCPAAFWDGPA